MSVKDIVINSLKPVTDPEIGLSIVDLGLIYDVYADGDRVNVRMTLTTAACPYGPELVDAVRQAVKRLEGVETVDIDVVWDPPWNPEEMASDYARDVLGIW